MADRVAGVLAASGARRVVRIGGETHADLVEDQGPLGGILTALTTLDDDVVVVAACDLPFLSSDAVSALVRAATAVEVNAAVPVVGGHPIGVCAAYRRSAELPLRAAFDAGLRSVRDALADLHVVDVQGLDDALTDVDTPADLRAARHRAQADG